MKHLPPTLTATLLLMLCLSACNWIKPKVKIPDLPYLETGKVNTFKPGDKFIISQSQNSCCMYYFMKDSAITETMPSSPLLKLVEIIDDPADPDCAGCSSNYYSIMECVATGTDTLRYFVLAMGDAGEATNGSELDSTALQQANSFTYIISVQN